MQSDLNVIMHRYDFHVQLVLVEDVSVPQYLIVGVFTQCQRQPNYATKLPNKTVSSHTETSFKVTISLLVRSRLNLLI